MIAGCGNYAVKEELRPAFERAIDEWICNGWLQPYDGPVKATIPLMAIEQSIIRAKCDLFWIFGG